MAIDCQVYVHRWFFVNPANPEGALQDMWNQGTALLWMCVVPNCCQRLFQPILWIVSVSATFSKHSAAACILIEDKTLL